MGTTESVLQDAPIDEGSQVPVPARRRRRRPAAQPTKPLLQQHGVVLGLPSSGKRTLLKRLEGKDPFKPCTEEPSTQVIVPFQSQSMLWDRVQLHVEIPDSKTLHDRIKGADFVVVLVHPQHDPKSIRPYFAKLLSSLLKQRTRPMALCILLNFRDQQYRHQRIQERDLEEIAQQILNQHQGQTNVVVQVGTTSLKDCYGLNTLHHFIYRSYLLRKQAEWSDQLRHCQKLIHETSAVPSIEYNEFLSLLLKSDDGPRNTNKKNVSWSEDAGMQRRSVVVRPHPPPLQKILPPASLEDFFAESDEDNETNNSNKNLVEECDSDDDDGFFYDEGGHRKSIADPSSQNTPTTKTTTTAAIALKLSTKKPPPVVRKLQEEGQEFVTPKEMMGVMKPPISENKAGKNRQQLNSKSKELKPNNQKSKEVTAPSEVVHSNTMQVSAIDMSDSKLTQSKNEVLSATYRQSTSQRANADENEGGAWSDDDDEYLIHEQSPEHVEMEQDKVNDPIALSPVDEQFPRHPPRFESSPIFGLPVLRGDEDEGGWSDEMDDLIIDDDDDDDEGGIPAVSSTSNKMEQPQDTEEDREQPIVNVVSAAGLQNDETVSQTAKDLELPSASESESKVSPSDASNTVENEVPPSVPKPQDSTPSSNQEFEQTKISESEGQTAKTRESSNSNHNDFAVGAIDLDLNCPSNPAPEQSFYTNKHQDECDDDNFITDVSAADPADPKLKARKEESPFEQRESGMNGTAEKALSSLVPIPEKKVCLSAAALAAIAAAEEQAKKMLQEEVKPVKKEKKKKSKEDKAAKKEKKKKKEAKASILLAAIPPQQVDESDSDW